MHEINSAETTDKSAFDKNAFRAGFLKRLSNWKSKWTGPDTGPVQVEPSYDLMSAEQHEADQPELEAKQQLIQYCVRAIREASTAEQRVEIVNLIKRGQNENLLGEKYAYDLLADIFRATVEQLD